MGNRILWPRHLSGRTSAAPRMAHGRHLHRHHHILPPGRNADPFCRRRIRTVRSAAHRRDRCHCNGLWHRLAHARRAPLARLCGIRRDVVRLAAMSGAAINIIIAPWFDKRRGLAISLALNGASAGGIVITPLLILLIERLHLASALLCIAGLMVAVLLPTAALFLRRKHPGERDHSSETTQTQLSAAPPWSPLALLYSWNFETISVPFALALMAQVGFLTHQVACLSPILGAAGAGWAVSLTTFSAVVGRTLTGLFVDKLDRRAAACTNFLVQFVGTALLASNISTAMLYLGCILFGLGLGNLVTLPALIVPQEFPKQHV